MLKIFTLLGIFLLYSCRSYAQALIEIPFSFNDGVGGTSTLTVGLDPSASDGLDATLGETFAPPLPPSGAYDVRFTLPSSSTQTFKDIRNGDNTAASIGNRAHTVNYQLGTSSTGLQISWSLPFGVGLNIKDPLGGILYEVNYPEASSNSYTITYVALTSFILTVKYVNPPFPVELTSFCGKLLNEKVELEWKTSTEINNYGFEIERKSGGNEWQNIGFVPGNGNCNSPKEYSFIDANIDGGSKFQYRLKQIDHDGAFEYSNIIEVDAAPQSYGLSRNFPNPFNPATTIRFSVPKATELRINVYTMLGEKMLTAIEGKFEPGFYKAEINAGNLPSGIYIYRLESSDFVQSKKMVLIK